jgi:TolB-like protein
MPDQPPPPDSSPAIFLSYASEDAEAARRLSEALKSAGLEVWFDQSELRGGDAWDQRIRRQIKECALFMPIISAHTQARPEGYFRLEWHLAEQRSYLMAQSKPFIVPVVVDETTDANALVPDRFRERQWSRLPGGRVPFDFAPRMARLLGGPILSSRPAQQGPRAATAPSGNERSVAILAFANLSKDEENEYFSDGVSDELLTVLQNIPGLRVAARTSAFFFKGKNASVHEIGSQLNVAHLVEGGVQKSGNRVKVAARLTNVATGEVSWSRSYTREIKDVFALQEELALAIVGELRGQLAGDVKLVQKANRGGTQNPEAYQNYLLGKHLYEQFSETGVSKATEHLQAATALDPGFALGWASLAEAHVWRCGYATLTREEFDSSLASARAATDRALGLEPDLGAALATLIWIQFSFEFDLNGAKATVDRATQVAPNDLAVLNAGARLLTTSEDAAESLAMCERLVAMDPINARMHLELAYVLSDIGRFEEARSAGGRFRILNPTGVMAPAVIAYVYAQEGRYEDAEKAMGRSSAAWVDLWLCAIISYGLGRRAESDAALAELVRSNGDSAALQVAEVHAVRDEKDLSFQWLERARAQRDPGIVVSFRSRFFGNLRSDPRWRLYWQKLGVLPE